MAKKPNENQLAVLKAMARGERLTFYIGTRGGDWCALSDTGRVNRGTVNSLETNGWVRSLPYQVGRFRRDYELTDAGRLVTEQS